MSSPTRSVVKACLYVLCLACTGLLKQIIHSAAWNPLNIWFWVSAGLTNIPTSCSTPPNSCTKLFHFLISFPLYLASLLKRERPSKTCSILQPSSTNKFVLCHVLRFCLLKWWSVFLSLLKTHWFELLILFSAFSSVTALLYSSSLDPESLNYLRL